MTADANTLIKWCSSQRFQDKHLCGRIPFEPYNWYLDRRDEDRGQRCPPTFSIAICWFPILTFWVETQCPKRQRRGVDDVLTGVDESSAQLQKQQQVLQALVKDLTWALVALAQNVIGSIEEFSNLVWNESRKNSASFLSVHISFHQGTQLLRSMRLRRLPFG